MGTINHTDSQSSLALHQTQAISYLRTRILTNQYESPRCQANSSPRRLSTLPLQNPILFPQRSWQNVMVAEPTENATLQSRAKSSMSQAIRVICQVDPTTSSPAT